MEGYQTLYLRRIDELVYATNLHTRKTIKFTGDFSMIDAIEMYNLEGFYIVSTENSGKINEIVYMTKKIAEDWTIK